MAGADIAQQIHDAWHMSDEDLQIHFVIALLVKTIWLRQLNQ